MIRSQLDVTAGILMEKGSGPVSGEHEVKKPQTRQQPIEVTVPQFEEWHPSHMKTGLKNRRLGKRVSVRVSIRRKSGLPALVSRL
jgi:hypothetical protein